MESGLKELESGSVSIALKATLLEYWNGEEWLPWSDYGMEAEGDVWIVKKNGELNQPAIESLMKWAGWDGNLESIANSTWQPNPVQVSVKKDDYKGSVRYKIAFVNDFDRTPGQLSNVTPDKLAALQTRFGSQLRAIAGNTKRNNGSTQARPATPPPPAARPTPPPVSAPFGGGGDVPF
jgi:hypothetical protein